MAETLPLHSLRGHHEARALLAQLKARGVQTLLFTGPSGVGRRRLARWYAQLLNCAASEQSEPCDRCESCRIFLRHDHPDYREIAPPTKTKRGRASRDPEIRIGDLVPRPNDNPNPLVPWLRIRPRYRYRVGVVDHADAITKEAANAFLKMLEEPPSYTVIILIAPSPQAMLSTIASRSTSVRLGTVNASDLVEKLSVEHPSERLGRPGQLMEALAFEQDFRDLVAQIDAYLESLADNLDAALTQADAFEKAWSNEILFDKPRFDIPELMAARLSNELPHHYAPALDALHRCEEALRTYGSPSLAVQVLTLELRNILNRAR